MTEFLVVNDGVYMEATGDKRRWEEEARGWRAAQKTTAFRIELR